MKHGNSIRAVALALTLCGLVGGTAAGDSIKCKAICPSGTECKTSDLAGPVRESWLIGNCENRERKVDRGCVNFWYFSKSTPQLARVCAVNEVAVALKDPDLSCSFLDCLWPKAPRAVPGANPIGSDDSSSTSSGAKAGLPFGTVLPSPGALSLMVSGPAAGESGTLTLFESASGRAIASVPIVAGVATLKSGVLAEESAYRYRWQAGLQILEGSFKTASSLAYADVDPPAAAGTPVAEGALWEQVRALAVRGYRWDAMQLARQLEAR